MDTFKQLVIGPVWDGNLVGKEERNKLVEAGLVARGNGYNYLTGEGIRIAVALGMLRA